jgi:hypothetical protein
MNISATVRALGMCAGLLVGPGIWAINTQLGQILPYVDCRAHIHWSALTSFGAATLALLAGFVSWHNGHKRTANDSTSQFLSSVSGLAALIFAFALAMQGTASLVLSGCEK